jgi:hypothetical protein
MATEVPSKELRINLANIALVETQFTLVQYENDPWTREVVINHCIRTILESDQLLIRYTGHRIVWRSRWFSGLTELAEIAGHHKPFGQSLLVLVGAIKLKLSDSRAGDPIQDCHPEVTGVEKVQVLTQTLCSAFQYFQRSIERHLITRYCECERFYD